MNEPSETPDYGCCTIHDLPFRIDPADNAAYCAECEWQGCREELAAKSAECERLRSVVEMAAGLDTSQTCPDENHAIVVAAMEALNPASQP